MNDAVICEYIKAGHVETPIAELDALGCSNFRVVRRRVAENSRTPVETLKKLSRDESPDVRMAVALNAAAPAELVGELANDNHPDVRYRIASTSYMQRCLLQQLSQDSNPHIVHRAKLTIASVDSAGSVHTIFEYLAADHAPLLEGFQSRFSDYSRVPSSCASEKITDWLDAVATHFSRQEFWLLSLDESKLPPDSESLKTLLHKSSGDCAAVREKISNLFVQAFDGPEFLTALKQLMEMVENHVQFSEKQLFAEVQRCLTVEEQEALNQRLQHALGVTSTLDRKASANALSSEEIDRL